MRIGRFLFCLTASLLTVRSIPGQTGAPALPRAAGTCAPTVLLLQVLSPLPGFSTVVGQPVAIQVAIIDNCGNPATSATSSAKAAFSDGDPGVTLVSIGGGRFQGTYLPTKSGSLLIQVTAFESSSTGAVLAAQISVTGTVQSGNAASLSITPARLSFSQSQGGQAVSQPITIVNLGAQSANFTATASTSWLSVSPSSGNSSPTTPGIVTVTAVPGALPPGTYTGVVTVQSAGVSLPPVTVTMTVSPPQTILLLSQTALSFTAAQGGGAPLPQDFGILNIGQGAMNWTAQASTLSGSTSWLSVSPASGTVQQPYLDVSLVNVSVDPTGLSAGTYYGQIQITASGANNSPQSVSIVLTMLPPGTNPGPQVRPSGFIFIAAPSGSSSGQSAMIANTSAKSSLFTSAPVTFPGVGTWFSYTPASTSAVPGQPVPINIQPNFSQLTSGATRGLISFLFDDGSTASIALLAVVPPSGAAPLERGNAPRQSAPAATGNCTPKQINIQPSGPSLVGSSLSASIGQPVTVEAVLADSCAQPVTSSSGAFARVDFSNGDQGIAMTHVGNGRWTATWQPQKTSPSGIYAASISVLEMLASGAVGGQIDIPVTLNGRADVPLVASGGVKNAGSFSANPLVAPGGLISIFGGQLTTGSPSQASQPQLPSQLGDTQVFLSGVPLPLLYASDGQINAQVPYALPVNVPIELIVHRGSAISVPQIVSVAPAQPAVFTKDQSGTGQGVIVNGVTNQFADSNAPVTAGDTIVIYCTGLGAVTPAVPSGVPATGQAPTVQPVSVTVGGQNANVVYAGLTPGYAGLYQVNAVVPTGVGAGSQVPVILSTAGQISPPVTIAVR